MHDVRLATEAMGTRFELVLFGADPGRLRAAGEAAIDAIEETHHRFSRFEPASLVSHLRRSAPAEPARLDRDTFALFADALAVHRASGGVFDITGGTGSFTLDAAAVTIRLDSTETQLDLGGIAKGHGLDLAARALRESGVHSAFVHGGTSSGVAIGQPPGRGGWRVALGVPPDAVVTTLVDAAFSVSATVRVAAHGGGGETHIIEPGPGGFVTRPRRVAAVGPSARLADAWTTAIAVRGTAPGAPLSGWRLWLQEDTGPWRRLVPEPAEALHGAS